MKFKVDDCVCWYAYSGKNTNLKQGEIIAYVASGESPKYVYDRDDLESNGKLQFFGGKPRDHQSYLIKAGSQVYWPVVSRLRKVVAANESVKDSKFTFPN